MAINPSALSSQSTTDPSTVFVLEALSSQPVVGTVFSPARPAGQLAFYYNGSTGAAELYVVAASGIRWLRVV